MKYGIAFAGGGIKSLSQLAVLSYLEEKGIDPYAVSGTSAGSLMAALVSLGLGAEVIEQEIKTALTEIEKEKVFKVTGKDLIFNKRPKHGLIDGIKIETILNKIFDKYNVHHISDVKVPLAITAVDLLTGELIIFTSHPKMYQNTMERTVVVEDISLVKAIRASMSFPLVFGSMEYASYSLVDGGLRMNCPVPMLRDYGATKTLAITMRNEETESEDVKGVVDVMGTVFEIVSHEAEKLHANSADYLLNISLGHPNIFDTKIADHIIEKGNEALINHSASLESFFNQKLRWWQKLSR